MYRWEQRVLVKHYLEQGLSKRAIAEAAGVSRRTIYYWIRSGKLERDPTEPVHYPVRVTKLDPYKAIIEERLNAFPALSAVRLFEEVSAAGYDGSLTQLKVFVREVRPRPPKEEVIRFETEPGRQAQVDFAEFKFPWGKRYALLVVLGYSRLLWVQFYRQQTMEILCRGIEEAFSYFGGVPRELLFDQLKAVIIEDGRPNDGKVIENPEFLRFAAHWGFRIRACRPYRAQTKGKIERPVRYLRGNFVYGRDFVSDDDLNHRTLVWLDDTANVRIHGTTDEVPLVRFERDERWVLGPLARRPYNSLLWGTETGSKPLVLNPESVTVERRPLCTYADLAGAVL